VYNDKLYEAWAKRCNVLPFDQLPRERPTIPAQAAGTRPQFVFHED
jgi:arylsulfatase